MAKFITSPLCARGAMALLLALGMHAAQAQTTANSICQDGKQDVAACQREVGATNNRTPVDPNQNFGDNALKRCQAHTNNPEARQACEDRVRNQSTRRDGSVFGGGTIQEHRTTTTTTSPAPAPGATARPVQ